MLDKNKELNNIEVEEDLNLNLSDIELDMEEIHIAQEVINSTNDKISEEEDNTEFFVDEQISNIPDEKNDSNLQINEMSNFEEDNDYDDFDLDAFVVDNLDERPAEINETELQTEEVTEDSNVLLNKEIEIEEEITEENFLENTTIEDIDNNTNSDFEIIEEESPQIDTSDLNSQDSKYLVEDIENNLINSDISKQECNKNYNSFEEELINLTINSNTTVSEELCKIAETLSKMKVIINEVLTTADELKLNSLKLDAQNDYVLNSLPVLNNFKEELTLQLVQLFEGISFSDEIIEIKESLEEKFIKINNLISDFSSNLQVSIVDKLSEKLDDILSTISSINTSNNLQQTIELPTIVKDNEEYSYTLIDVESDLAKMRMALNDITSSIRDINTSNLDCLPSSSQLECLCDDISSISKRTNKLILTTEDSHKTLKHYLEEFEKVITLLDEKTGKLNLYPQVASIHNKLENLTRMFLSSAKSDKLLNDALMYLAQWIDESAQLFNEMQNDLKHVKDTKFREQSTKIAALEEKVDNIAETENTIKTLLEKISMQLEQANSNSNLIKSVDEKLELLDHRLTKFERNINKIASYIDE